MHPYLSRAFQQYEMHGCGFGDLNGRNNTNKQPSLKDRLVWHMLLTIIEFLLNFRCQRLLKIQYIPAS